MLELAKLRGRMCPDALWRCEMIYKNKPAAAKLLVVINLQSKGRKRTHWRYPILFHILTSILGPKFGNLKWNAILGIFGYRTVKQTHSDKSLFINLLQGNRQVKPMQAILFIISSLKPKRGRNAQNMDGLAPGPGNALDRRDEMSAGRSGARQFASMRPLVTLSRHASTRLIRWKRCLRRSRRDQRAHSC